MLTYFRTHVGWGEIGKRTALAVNKDDVLGLAAQLAYAFIFSLFPMLIFLVAVASFFPLQGLIDQLTARAGTLLPEQLTSIVTGQLKSLSNSNQGGLLTFGILLTIFSASSGMAAVMNALNRAYGISEGRPWWKVRLIAIGLTLALAAFALVSLALVMVGPGMAERIANWVGLGSAFALAWQILQWPVAFILVSIGVALVYYFGPDAEQDFVFITPGSLLATLLWVVASLGFKVYIANFNSYNATYGTLGGAMIALTWLYITGIVLLIGAELNSEIENASPYGKESGEKKPGARRKIGAAAARAWEEARRLAQHGSPQAAPAMANARQLTENAKTAGAPVPTAARRRAEAATAFRPAAPVSPKRQRTGRKLLAGVIAGEVVLAVWNFFRRSRTEA